MLLATELQYWRLFGLNKLAKTNEFRSYVKTPRVNLLCLLFEPIAVNAASFYLCLAYALKLLHHAHELTNYRSHLIVKRQVVNSTRLNLLMVVFFFAVNNRYECGI